MIYNVLFLEKCDPGSFYNVISSACENCSRHSYQDSAGQSFCHYCESGFVTQEEQSTSESDCKGVYIYIYKLGKGA